MYSGNRSCSIPTCGTLFHLVPGKSSHLLHLPLREDVVEEENLVRLGVDHLHSYGVESVVEIRPKQNMTLFIFFKENFSSTPKSQKLGN